MISDSGMEKMNTCGLPWLVYWEPIVDPKSFETKA